MTPTNSISDCQKMTAEVNKSSPPGFLGFVWCSAAPYYLGDQNANLQSSGMEGCYPVLTDPADPTKYLAPKLNKNIVLDSSVKPTCLPTSTGGVCQYDPARPGWCKGASGCEKNQTVCQTKGFGNIISTDGKTCVLDIINPATFTAGAAGEDVYLCEGSCDTALGLIPTSPVTFTVKFLKFIIAISGGIILIMAIVSGYNVATSTGDPQKLAGSKEMIVSLIGGTILIVFSLVLLNAIGIDILGIPNFIKYTASTY